MPIYYLYPYVESECLEYVVEVHYDRPKSYARQGGGGGDIPPFPHSTGGVHHSHDASDFRTPFMDKNNKPNEPSHDRVAAESP